VRRPDTSDLLSNLRFWQSRYKEGWGLAWYLAAELCDRFYVSHGIRPTVIVREGLGYYGIAQQPLPCHGAHRQTLGRLTMGGNLENWLTGGPGDHGLQLIERFTAGEPADVMVPEVIRFLELPRYPPPVHSRCRHKRWGGSYQLLFRLSALLALRWNDRVRIWNDPSCMMRDVPSLDLKANLADHPGYFLLQSNGIDLVITGDGRVISCSGEASIWDRYMTGESVSDLVRWAERYMGLIPSRVR
jgi:hypothetical protein